MLLNCHDSNEKKINLLESGLLKCKKGATVQVLEIILKQPQFLKSFKYMIIHIQN